MAVSYGRQGSLGQVSLIVWCCSGDAIAPCRQRLHECWAGV